MTMATSHKLNSSSGVSNSTGIACVIMDSDVLLAGVKREVIDVSDENSSSTFPTSSSPSTSTTNCSLLTGSSFASTNTAAGSRRNGRERHSSSSSSITNSTSSIINTTIGDVDFRDKRHELMDLNSRTGSMDQSPVSSPLSPIDSHHQDMFCTSTMSGDGMLAGSGLDGLADVRVCDNSQKKLCLVCGDIASGYHYGVASCEACKAFFKRTIQGNIEYTCPASNDCEINKRRRKACQACRFQKCLGKGMLKEGVRLDRVRGGRQKYRRNPDSPYQVQNASPSKKPSIEDNRILAALLVNEPEPLSAITSDNKLTLSPSSAHFRITYILSDLVDRELVNTIGWAKQIIGFNNVLLNDQMRLLQSSWAEIVGISLAYRSYQHMTSSPSNCSSSQLKLVFANDFVMDEQQAALCNAEQIFIYCNQIVKRFALLKITKEEYVLLKSLIVANVDIQLEDAQAVHKMRESLVMALQECVSVLRPYDCVNHLSQLLLSTPLLRQTDAVIRRYWQGIHREGKVPMNKLFVEMLESSIPFR